MHILKFYKYCQSGPIGSVRNCRATSHCVEEGLFPSTAAVVKPFDICGFES